MNKKKTVRQHAPINRTDGITSFREEFGFGETPFGEQYDNHPGRKMFQEYIQAYAYLDPVEQAQHKLADSPTWRNYRDAMQLGIQIYNQRTTGGLHEDI